MTENLAFENWLFVDIYCIKISYRFATTLPLQYADYAFDLNVRQYKQIQFVTQRTLRVCKSAAAYIYIYIPTL